MDNFEKYMRENRGELDRLEPLDDKAMWKGVVKRMPPTESPPKGQAITNHGLRSKWKWLAMAASVAALIGWALYFFQPVERPFSLADISPELAEREADLLRLISQKETEIGLDQLDRAAFAEVFGELAELENSAAVTRQDLAEGQTKERTLETLLRQYELKIRILENLKREIEKKEYHDELEKEI